MIKKKMSGACILHMMAGHSFGVEQSTVEAARAAYGSSLREAAYGSSDASAPVCATSSTGIWLQHSCSTLTERV